MRFMLPLFEILPLNFGEKTRPTSTMDKKFDEGEAVFERTRPTNPLIVSRYNDGLYYCKTLEDPNRELVYFERELGTRKSGSESDID